MKNYTRYIVFFGIAAVLVGLIVWSAMTPGKYDKLATCLKDQGVTFYGAFWCPHCQATKKAFGKSTKLLPYQECSSKVPNAQGGYDQLKICTDAAITGYPTWQFPQPITLAKTDSDTLVECKVPFTTDQPRDCEGSRPGTWIATIGGREFSTLSKPVSDATNWTLPPLSRTTGEVPLETIAALAQCSLN